MRKAFQAEAIRCTKALRHETMSDVCDRKQASGINTQFDGCAAGQTRDKGPNCGESCMPCQGVGDLIGRNRGVTWSSVHVREYT